MYRDIVSTFLGEIAEIIDTINSSGYTKYNPRVALLSSVMLASLVSFSRNMLVYLLVIALSIVIVLDSRRIAGKWLKVIALTLAMVTLVSTPIPLLIGVEEVFYFEVGGIAIHVFREGLEEAIHLVLRTTAASSIFTAFIMTLGWRGVYLGLRELGLPSSLGYMVVFYIRYIPIFSRDIVRFLLGREARRFSKGLRGIWSSLPTVVGEIFLRGFDRAFRLELALEARGFLDNYPRGNVLSPRDYTILLSTLAIVVTGSVVNICF